MKIRIFIISQNHKIVLNSTQALFLVCLYHFRVALMIFSTKFMFKLNKCINILRNQNNKLV
jgi:hypothetical protein